MSFLIFLSETMIPILIFCIVAAGISRKQNVYDEFVHGAVKGLKTVAGIAPTLIGLMIAVGVLRASGFLDFLSGMLQRLLGVVHFPAELVPLAVIKMFSSSAATGLLLDIFRKFGTDSRNGLIASIMLSSTETIFYTMSVYFMAAKVKRTRYTLPGALIATAAGIAASVWLSDLMLAK